LFADYYAGDIKMFTGLWYQNIVSKGTLAAFSEPFSNYTPPYLYLLGAMTPLHDLLPTQYVVKLLSWFGALWLVFATYRLLQAAGSRVDAAPTVLLLPSIIANVSMLGQADTFWVAPCVLALANAIERKHSWTAVWSGVALAFKAQAVFFAPFVTYVFFKERVTVWKWLIPGLVYAVAMLPAWLAGWPAWDLATVYLRQAEWQPDGGYFISNSGSIWTLYGWWHPSMAIETYWAGFAAAAIATLAYWLFLPALDRPKMIVAAALSASLVPFCLPGMHDRFFILADVLAFLYAVVRPSRRSIAAAILMQIGSTFPVFAWAFELHGWELLAPPFVAAAIFLFVRELGGPAELRSLSRQ
jgi:Gpi18-like mannosyltransferase